MEKILLNYLLTEAHDKLFRAVPAEVFNDPIIGLTLGVSQQFYDTYKGKPRQESWSKYLQNVKTIPDDLKQEISKCLLEALAPFTENLEFYRQEAINSIKLKIVERMQLDIAEHEGDTEYAANRTKKMLSELTELDLTDNASQFSLSDPNFAEVANVDVIPSPYKNLNMLTEDGGFAAPSLVVVAAPPKTNKTTFLVNLAVGYARQGIHVLIVDFENGERNMRKRFRQRVATATSQEFKSGDVLDTGLTAQQMFAANVKAITRLGGDVHFFCVPVNSVGLSSVESEILRLKSIGIDIKAIIYDSVEQSQCEDKTIRDDVHKIQWKYLSAIKLNQKFNTFCFTPSHINREGIKALKVGVVGGEFLAGDIGKLQNAHAVFLLEYKEIEDFKVLFLHVLAQREGVRSGRIAFSLDMPIQLIREIEYTETTNLDKNVSDD